MLSRVFDLFAQGAEPMEGSQSGLGIGLALARRLIEMHDGRIDAYSDGPGRGSRFVIRLPLAQQAEARAKTRGHTRRITSRVLIVDDNDDAARSMAMLVEALGGRAAAAHDGLTGRNSSRTSCFSTSACRAWTGTRRAAASGARSRIGARQSSLSPVGDIPRTNSARSTSDSTPI